MTVGGFRRSVVAKSQGFQQKTGKKLNPTENSETENRY
jgi:hypothetical protein